MEKEIIKIEGYEEISLEEHHELPNDEGLRLTDDYENKHYYFKKAQKSPIVFEDKWFQFELEQKFIRIIARDTGTRFRFDYKEAFPLLVKAVEKAKEVMKKNEK